MNVQDECIKIHSKFGMSEMANYKIQLLFDSEIEKVKKEYEEKLRWIPIEEKYPICYESGEWDGLRSEEIIFKCKNGDKYIGRLYSGFLDGSEYNDFTDISSFIIPNVTEWRFL